VNKSNYPVLYSFRRCPYAIRARIALLICDQKVELREVLLSRKPAPMIEASAKATVPVLCLTDGSVLEQSLEIMQWAVVQCNDTAQLFSNDCQPPHQLELIARNDADFKYWLDRYKYHVRYPEHPLEYYREQGAKFLASLETRLAKSRYLFGARPQLADVAIMPFVRQFSTVDRAWFAGSVSPLLDNWLSGWLENPLFIQSMEKFPRWQAGQAPVYLQGNADQCQ